MEIVNNNELSVSDMQQVIMLLRFERAREIERGQELLANDLQMIQIKFENLKIAAQNKLK